MRCVNLYSIRGLIVSSSNISKSKTNCRREMSISLGCNSGFWQDDQNRNFPALRDMINLKPALQEICKHDYALSRKLFRDLSCKFSCVLVS